MDIRKLRYFVQIVESGSLSKAAREVHVAQPALSQQLAALEDEVGKPLLVRSSKGVAPTENGLALYHHARFMIHQLDKALSIARSETPALQGMVSVGLPATTVAALGLRLVKRVRDRYPGILLNVVEGMSGHIADLMRRQQLDLAVLFGGQIISDFPVRPLLVEELFVITRKESRFVAPDARSISIEAVSQIPLILPTGSHGLRQRISAEFENRGLPLNVMVEIDSLALVMSCIREDLGATIKPIGAMMHGDGINSLYRAIPFSNATFRRQNFLYSLPSERISPAALAVATEIGAAAQELIADDTWPGIEPIATGETVFAETLATA